jgi:tetratricopeptide (TPR) repeat protein
MKAAFFISAMALICLVITGCHYRNTQDCADLLEKYKRMSSDHTVKADTALLFGFLDDIISKDPQCNDAYLTRGDLFLAKNDFQEAQLDYKTALARDRNNVYAFFKLGLLCQQEDLYDSSIYFLQKAINVKTHNGWVVDFHHLNRDIDPTGSGYDVETGALFYAQGVSAYYKRDPRTAFNDFSFCITYNYQIG